MIVLQSPLLCFDRKTGLHPVIRKESKAMAMDPNDAVNIPKGPGGPKTDAGKQNSSRNAIRTGLYAARDFIREGEEEEYAQSLIRLMDELTPDGTLEETFATEIMGATWRLRRCRLVEEAFGSVNAPKSTRSRSTARALNRISSSADPSPNLQNSKRPDFCASKARTNHNLLPDRRLLLPARPPASTP